ncbi:MAG: secretin N-terminal domain-containing protein, partial [Nitrospinota bacterium]
ILVEHADAIEIASTLTEMFDSLGYKAQDTGSRLKFVPVERLNALIIINPFLELLPNIESWISRLDTPAMEGLEEKTFIYYVQNAKAGDLASLLTTLYQSDTLTSSKEEMDRRFRVSRKEPRKEKTASKEKKVKGKTKPEPKKSLIKVKILQSEEVTGKILFVADEFTNALIIKTLPRNYPAILETIKLLDLMPLQVMIEVLVLELTIDDQTRAGIDWAFKSGDLAVGSAAASQSISVGAVIGESATSVLSQGFSIVAQSQNFTALLQAFAQDSKLNVLSNPILITSENKPATISITNDIPVETSSITTPTAGQPLTQTSIQYKSVGIKLNITPQINRDRFVSLQISQESSNVNEAAAFSQPAFFTRSTNTNVVVKDRQTLVIGGLMETTKSHSDTGVPILKDIPILGHLFKAKSDRLRKTELIIFITPYVIANISEANEATKGFRAKLLNIKKDFKLEKQKN